MPLSLNVRSRPFFYYDRKTSQKPLRYIYNTISYTHTHIIRNIYLYIYTAFQQETAHKLFYMTVSISIFRGEWDITRAHWSRRKNFSGQVFDIYPACNEWFARFYGFSNREKEHWYSVRLQRERYCLYTTFRFFLFSIFFFFYKYFYGRIYFSGWMVGKNNVQGNNLGTYYTAFLSRRAPEFLAD